MKKFTILLVLLLIVMTYQSFSLLNLSKKLDKAEIGLAKASAVTLSGSGNAPDMVGGC